MKTIGTILDALKPSVDAELYDDVHQIINDGFRTVEKLREKNADLRQRLEDTDALLIIARAERDTARETQEQLQSVVTAQEAEIKRLKEAVNERDAAFSYLMMRFS